MTRVLFAIAALVFVGCASSQASREPPARPPAEQAPARGPMMGQQDMQAMCPMMVEGTTVRAEEVEGGAALVFTTTGDVADLRRRVARMTEMHNRHQSHGGMMGGPEGHPEGRGRGQRHEHGAPGERGPHGGGMMGGQGMMMAMIPADARVEEIEGGARVVLTPQNPAQLQALREQVRHRAERMTSGQCPMMSDRSTQPADPDPEDASEHRDHHPDR
jgi:hypothetical protein